MKTSYQEARNQLFLGRQNNNNKNLARAQIQNSKKNITTKQNHAKNTLLMSSFPHSNLCSLPHRTHHFKVRTNSFKAFLSIYIWTAKKKGKLKLHGGVFVKAL